MGNHSIDGHIFRMEDTDSRENQTHGDFSIGHGLVAQTGLQHTM